jgi:hypothetical protein
VFCWLSAGLGEATLLQKGIAKIMSTCKTTVTTSCMLMNTSAASTYTILALAVQHLLLEDQHLCISWSSRQTAYYRVNKMCVPTTSDSQHATHAVREMMVNSLSKTTWPYSGRLDKLVALVCADAHRHATSQLCTNFTVLITTLPSTCNSDHMHNSCNKAVVCL